MADDYLDTFNERGDQYNEATRVHPSARDKERGILLDLLAVESSHRVCDAPAGGGYLADGIRPLVGSPEQIVCIEPSQRFAEAINPDYVVHLAPLDSLPLAEGSIDRCGSLAGLHHVEDKRPFFSEVLRVLIHGGRFVVADVLDATPVARFLNGPVDRFSPTGHRGMFMREGQTERMLLEAGFDEVSEVHEQFDWTFESEDQMVRYCMLLFGLTRAGEDEVRHALFEGFDIRTAHGKVCLPWSLFYAVGERAA